jgi:hypothetical protein
VNKCRCKIIVEEGLDKYEIDGMNFDFFEDFEQLNEKI